MYIAAEGKGSLYSDSDLVVPLSPMTEPNSSCTYCDDDVVGKESVYRLQRKLADDVDDAEKRHTATMHG